MGHAQPRMRSPNKASSTRAISFRRHTSFRSTKLCHTTRSFERITAPDRETSKRQVQRLMNLRGQRLRDAERNRDNPTAYKPRHPNLFEDSEKPEAEDEGLERGGHDRSSLRPSMVYEIEPVISTMAGDPAFTSYNTVWIMNTTFYCL